MVRKMAGKDFSHFYVYIFLFLIKCVKMETIKGTEYKNREERYTYEEKLN